MTKNIYEAAIEEIRKDPVRLKAFLRKVMGPAHRTLEGKEYDDVWFLLHLTEPFNQSNNQHSWTDEYKLGGKLYHVTYFPGDGKPIIDEVEEDDIQQD